MKQLPIFLFVLLAMACNQHKVDQKNEGEKVMQTSKEWSQTAATGDTEKTLSYWAEDAVLMSDGQPPLNGKAAIRQMVEQSMKMPGFRISWQPQSVQVSESGDMAYLIENSQVSYLDSTGKSTTTNSKVVTIWRKQADGSWKNVVDISTPDGTK
jgi:uncharacterized protein (TIGR02246 family)